jgi:hypothetical protein
VVGEEEACGSSLRPAREIVRASKDADLDEYCASAPWGGLPGQVVHNQRLEGRTKKLADLLAVVQFDVAGDVRNMGKEAVGFQSVLSVMLVLVRGRRQARRVEGRKRECWRMPKQMEVVHVHRAMAAP